MLKLLTKYIVKRRRLYFGLLCFVPLVLVKWKHNGTTAAILSTGTATTTTTPITTNTTTKIDQILTTTISCGKLIQGQTKEIKRAQNVMKNSFRRSYLPEVYESLTRNCSSYVSKRGYINYTATREEKLFPLAFSLLVYKHAEQVETLLRAIWRPHNLYCIHIDKQSSSGFTDAIQSIAKCFTNVFIHPTSLSVVWGTFTVLEPELNCMDLLWKQKQKWKYFINLTGQEFPLKTNYELSLILKAYNGANDIHRSARPNLDRWEGHDDPPYNITPVKGSVHIAASREFVNYVLHNTTALDLLEWVKETATPDETYFSSLNYNPHLEVPGSHAGETDDGEDRDSWTRYKIWYDPNLCAGKFVRSICIFSVGDLVNLTTSKYMFANKFHYNYDYMAYDCLESWYHGKVAREKKGVLDFKTTEYSERWVVKHHF